MTIREPAVAGIFYPVNAGQLKRLVEECFTGPGGPGSLPAVSAPGPRSIVGLVCPHAGLIYSGPVAAWSYYRMAEDGVPDTIVIIGPNHRSHYPAAALTDDDAWRTPMGQVEVDVDLSRRIAESCFGAEVNSTAHRSEHSLEVQLPFIQYLMEESGLQVKIVPILIGSPTARGALSFARDLGGAIASALEGKDALIIASTDFTHYEPGDVAAHKDSDAMTGVLELDEEDLLKTVISQGITMCGVLPTAITIVSAKQMGAVSARKLAYRNSGDVTGDYREVVGYGALEMDR
jgi:hypothetical protein